MPWHSSEISAVKAEAGGFWVQRQIGLLWPSGNVSHKWVTVRWRNAVFLFGGETNYRLVHMLLIIIVLRENRANVQTLCRSNRFQQDENWVLRSSLQSESPETVIAQSLHLENALPSLEDCSVSWIRKMNFVQCLDDQESPRSRKDMGTMTLLETAPRAANPESPLPAPSLRCVHAFLRVCL